MYQMYGLFKSVRQLLTRLRDQTDKYALVHVGNEQLEREGREESQQSPIWTTAKNFLYAYVHSYDIITPHLWLCCVCVIIPSQSAMHVLPSLRYKPATEEELVKAFEVICTPALQ